MARDPLRRVLRMIEGRLLQELVEVEDRFDVRLDLRLVRGDKGRLTVVAIDPAIAPETRFGVRRRG